ncbi:hypothetical protein Fmac_016151 [Flemingia macrophylla]|uniref:Uncharacterized protein n=1 Tax=Flemingia macrophylla TaxID=520843 RepID=A0ABD1MHE4_9FABA
MVLNNEDLVQVASVEVGDYLLEGEVEKSGLIADSGECIGILIQVHLEMLWQPITIY